MLAHDRVPDLDDYRRRARSWLREAFAELQSGWEGPFDPLSYKVRKAWEDRVCQAGYSGITWPKRYGGQELPLTHYIAFLEESARAGCPGQANSMGHGILGPMILHYGSEAQKQAFIPPLVRNETVWCQGWSEPQAGSDLASLAATARLEGDVYRVNGHKIWTSNGPYADWCFALARTDPDSRRHEGISFLLIDMKSPGVRVAPIRQINGATEFSETFFEDVRVPVANRVGSEGQGWRMAMAAANFERATYFVPRQIQLEEELRQVWRLAASRCGDASLAAVAETRRRLTDIAVQANGLRLIAERTLELSLAGDAPGPESSYSKLIYTETWRDLYDLAMELLEERGRIGPDGPPDRQEARFARLFTSTKALTIAGGTSEIHRNIIAERLLGLPR